MTSFSEHLLTLAFEAKALGEQIDDGVCDMDDVDDLAELLVAVRDAVSAVRTAQTQVERVLIEAMPDRKMEIDGVGLVEKSKRVRYSKWDTDSLVSEVHRRAEPKVDTDTGELLESEAEAAFRLLLTWARPEWRPGALKNDGIQVDEFCQVTPDGWSVRVT